MDTFQLITIKSSDPFIRGLQYGQQAEALIHLGIEGYQRHFSKTLDLTWKDITEKSRLYLDLLEREFPEELEEARGIAEGSSVPLEDILVLNCRYEILKYRPHECTTGAILPVVSADRCSTFLIQNWDYRPWVEHHAVVVSIDDEKGTHIVGVTEAGQLVRNVMNSWGAGLCANNLAAVFDTGDVGAPVGNIVVKEGVVIQEACLMDDLQGLLRAATLGEAEAHRLFPGNIGHRLATLPDHGALLLRAEGGEILVVVAV